MAINQFDPGVYKDQRGYIWWEPDKFEQNLAQVSCTFESYDTDVEIFTGTFTPAIPPITADMDCDHEAWVYALYDDLELFQARNLSPLSGDIDCTFESYPVDIEVFTGTVEAPAELTGDVDCTGQEPVCIMQAGLHMDCTMVPWEFNSHFDIRGSEVDNCVFPLMRMEAYGNATFNTIILRTERLTLEMWEASDLTLQFERMDIQMTAIQGNVCNMNCIGRRPDALFTSVETDGLDLEFEEPTIEMTGDTPIRSSLIGTTRLFQLEMQATTPAHSSMELSFRPWTYVSYVDFSSYITASLDCTARPLVGVLTGIKGIDGDLDLIMRRWELSMDAYTDGNNDMVITLPEFEVALDTGGVPGTETCETAEDLVYEEVI